VYVCVRVVCVMILLQAWVCTAGRQHAYRGALCVRTGVAAHPHGSAHGLALHVPV
jgi:hypothetical protein